MRTTAALSTLLIFAASGAPGAFGQDGPAATPTCGAELEWAAEYAARNYSGFETKTAGSRRAAYVTLLEELRPAAAAAETTGQCDGVLRRWTAFFRDGHLSISRRSAATTAAADDAAATDDEIRARFADWPRRALSDGQARDRLAGLGHGRAPIEGIWEIADGSYRGVILRDEDRADRYTMTILQADSVWWTPGQVKARFTPTARDGYDATFYMRDHSEQAWSGAVSGNVLTFDRGSPWFRTWPVEAGDLSREQYEATRNAQFGVRDLAAGTVLVQIPSFNDAAGIDALFAAERERIHGAEQLIIDLRGNGGGSDYNFRELVPLIYTGPIRMVSNAALATEDNIRANERIVADTTIAQGIRTALAGSVAQMRTALGGWYEFPDRVVDDLVELELPRRIAVLVDRGCASSCEQFLLTARQSRKVTLYGTRTAGILDFGNVRSAEMPGGTLVLNHPTTRSKRLPHAPVDETGVIPDVEVPAAETDPIDWVHRQLQESR